MKKVNERKIFYKLTRQNFGFIRRSGYVLVAFCIGLLPLYKCNPASKLEKSSQEKTELLSLQKPDGRAIAIESKENWGIKRLQIIENMQKGMGEIPSLQGLPEFDLQYTDSLRGTNYMRYSIKFWVAENERLTAYLYIPDNLKNEKLNPAMLALHETDPLGKGSVDGQGVNKNLAYAKELAQRGYIVIAPDYPSFGDMKDYDFDKDRYQSGTMKGIFDHIRCIDLLQSMPKVDPEKIGVIGHSLGGHNSIFVGAIDTRLKIVVSSCGWTGFHYYDIGEEAARKYGGRLGPFAQKRYMPLLRDKYNLDEKKIPFDFDEMIAAIAPRIFFSNSPVHDKNFSVEGVKNGIENASAVYKLLGVPGNLQVYYPDAKHDFPTEIREKAYGLIDQVFQHRSNQ